MYTVKSGDSLYQIAKKYNTTVNEIIKLNNLTSTNLSIGQIIRIPEMYTKQEDMVLPDYISYTVKKGDSLYSIAKQNDISVDTLIKDNGLTNNNLKIGQVLKIRITTIPVEECYGPDYIPKDNFDSTTYIVKKGDSLYSIAKKFNTSVSTITNLNKLNSKNLSIGQQLKIPISSNSSSNQTYIVKKGDNLYSVAKKFNTTIDEIKRKNNLKTNLLSIGQKLII